MKCIKPQEVYDKLDQIEKQIKTSNESFLTAEETSKFLGFKLTYLYELTSKRIIPFYKPSGKKLLFKKTDLIDWIEKSKNKSVSEIEVEIVQREWVNNLLSNIN